jgi:hypothetical protein
MNTETIGMTVNLSQMRRNMWIKYKWVNIQTLAESEPNYLCTGLRDIAEAREAAEQFDTSWQARHVDEQ